MTERTLSDIVDRAAAGVPLDRVESDAGIDPADLPAVLQLRSLSPLLQLVPPDQHRLVHLTAGWFGIVMALALGIASVKVVAALGGALLPDAAANAIPTVVFSLVVLIYGSMGLILTIGGRWDERARSLGWLYLLTASFFCNRQIATLKSALPAAWSAAFSLLERIPVDAIAPAAVWLFVARFPEAPAASRPQRLAKALTMLSAAVGVSLLVANIVVAARSPEASGWLARFDHRRSDSFYYQSFLTLVLVPFVLFAKTRQAGADERRRVRHFCAALAVGFAPIVLATILRSPASPMAAWFTRERTQQVGVLIFAGLLSVPFTTTWAVTVSNVLDVRFFARAAVRAAATRGALATVTLLPFVLLLRTLYLGRDLPLRDLVAGSDARLLMSLLGLGIVLTVLHPRIVRWVNCWLLRQRPEAADAAARVAAAARRTRSGRELAEVIAREIEALYQPERVALLVLDRASQVFSSADGLSPPLPGSSGLVYVLDETRDALAVDPSLHGDLFHLLPPEDRQWLTACPSSHLLPLRGRDDRLIGVLVLGRRRGDLEFSDQDLRAIGAISEAAGLVLENLGLQQPGDRDIDAVQCSDCGAVVTGSGPLSRCGQCGGELMAAPVPVLLSGKYRVEQLLGRGAMGSVYRAFDERLKRPVAIKALHEIDRALVDTLLAEARLAAAVDLPGVVHIFAVEEWRGVPILVMEFLAGGTLDDRLRSGSLDGPQLAQVGGSLARTLSALHGRHIAHRDIKPGNIGFRLDGSPCLLDLGLAGEARTRPWDHDHVGGTLSYVAPFVLAGSSDYARGDAWSLCQTLLESLTGKDDPARISLRQMLTELRELSAHENFKGVDLVAERLDAYLSGSGLRDS